MKIMSAQEVTQKLAETKNSFWPTYRAFYSSWFGGVVLDPAWMMVPLDDHLVHRGDGVFEALRAIQGRLWLGNAHFNRLLSSAQQIGLKHQYSVESLRKICDQTLEASQLQDAILRVFLSRGPGSFSTNPYDSLGAQLYVVVCDFKPPSLQWIEEGVIVQKSKIPVKDPWLARIKSCNYLQNVLMKKESVDLGCDFVVGVDDQDCITESSTENIFWIDAEGFLVHPPLSQILAGTTLAEVCRLAQEHQLVKGVREQCLRWQDLDQQKAFMMAGTTLDVLPVRRIGFHEFSDFSLARTLRSLLLKKQIVRGK